MGYHAPGHPERPERIGRTRERLRRAAASGELQFEWAEPLTLEDESLLLRAHEPSLLQRLNEAGVFDADTPNHPGIAAHARRAVGAALAALQSTQRGEVAFSLMRPPGHHATRRRIMGFCYLNNVAIAVLEARARGVKRVAIFDFDVHHGNGTEDIVVNRSGITFYSVHQHPLYPGTGTQDVGDNCFNFPVPLDVTQEDYRQVLDRALAAMAKAKPDLIAVSAGFDAYVRDPLARGALEDEDFHWLGKQLRSFAVPTFAVLEGGYSSDLPELILAFLKGLAGR